MIESLPLASEYSQNRRQPTNTNGVSFGNTRELEAEGEKSHSFNSPLWWRQTMPSFPCSPYTNTQASRTLLSVPVPLNKLAHMCLCVCVCVCTVYITSCNIHGTDTTEIGWENQSYNFDCRFHSVDDGLRFSKDVYRVTGGIWMASNLYTTNSWSFSMDLMSWARR